MNNQLLRRPEFVLSTAAALLCLAAIVKAEDPPSASTSSASRPESRPLTVRVINADGKPIAGAKIGDYASWEKDEDLPEMHGLGDPREDIDPQVTDAEGECKFDAATVAKFQEGPNAVYAIAADRELVGLADLSKPNGAGEIDVAMVPWCVLTLNLDSVELAKLGQPFELAKGYISWQESRPFFAYSTKKRLRFLLPAGKYEINAYGSKLVTDNDLEVEIAPGERSKAVNIDLPPSQLAHLIGRPAPALDHVAAWKNSKPVKLADLHGRVVLLDFWGTWCGPCVASMPKLIDLYREFHDRGLEVIAVHTAPTDSLEDLDKRLAETSTERWAGAELPFPLAVDGGADLRDRWKHFGATTAEYGIWSWPTAILIDRKGNVVGDFNYRADDAREKLGKILAESSPQ